MSRLFKGMPSPGPALWLPTTVEIVVVFQSAQFGTFNEHTATSVTETAHMGPTGR